jgi:hypothetical protein
MSPQVIRHITLQDKMAQVVTVFEKGPRGESRLAAYFQVYQIGLGLDDTKTFSLESEYWSDERAAIVQFELWVKFWTSYRRNC